MTKTMQRLVTIAFIGLLSGCAMSPVFYQYAGSPKPASDESVISFTDSDELFVRDLDGKILADPLTTWNGGYIAVREIHLVPGSHTLVGQVQKGNGFAWYSLTYDFRAGHRYHLAATQSGYGFKVAVVDLN
jgi:hypothetical protein